MPVNSTNSQYDAQLGIWKRCRDVFAGADAIRQAGELYLPKLDGQDENEYRAYKNRALWYGAMARTVQGLQGAVFRKDPITEVPEDLLPDLADITLDGVSFEGFAKKILQEVLVVGRAGLLVDMPADNVSTRDRRPYWIVYHAEQIVNWKTRRVNGKTLTSLVVLKENVNASGDDEFANSCKTQYRVLKLDQTDRYIVEIWKEVITKTRGQNEAAFVLADTFIPTRTGERLGFIPFWFVGPNAITPDVEKPPLLDLVEVNLWHYQRGADYAHALHYVACPTPWATGFPEDTVLRIGSGTAWISPNPDGKVGMLEVNNDLGALTTALENAEKKMAALGARLLEQQKAGVEAAESVRLRQSGEHGSLQSISTTASQALSSALAWHAEWVGKSAEGVRTQLNKDFYDTSLTPEMLKVLMLAMQTGAISRETWYYNLERGEVTRPGVSLEEEQALIEAQMPTEPADDDVAGE